MMSEGDAIIERMYECMDLFSEATNAWFKHAFNAPTEAQRLAWPAIRSGENVLVVAPTGSGKTLCAFLSAIDRLMTKGGDGLLRTSGGGDGTAESDCNAKKRKPVRGVKVLYISPLKALGVDVAKNLQAPLAGHRRTVRGDGIAIAESQREHTKRRHHAAGTAQNRQPSAGYPRNHARIAVPAAHLQGATDTFRR